MLIMLVQTLKLLLDFSQHVYKYMAKAVCLAMLFQSIRGPPRWINS